MLTRDVMIKQVVTNTKDVSVKQCIEVLFKRHVGSMVIIDADEKCIGIFTERDAIRVVAQDVPLDVPIEKVMTRNVFTISQDAPFQEAKAIITFYKFRHLPAVDSEGKLVGLVSVRDILTEITGM